jgi:hypothetical protein
MKRWLNGKQPITETGSLADAARSSPHRFHGAPLEESEAGDEERLSVDRVGNVAGGEACAHCTGNSAEGAAAGERHNLGDGG